MSSGLARRIARFASALDWRHLSAARQRKVRWCLADFVACTAAGASLAEAECALVLARPGDVEVPGIQQTLSPESAMVAMGTLGALLQIHDGFGQGGCHSCSSVVPAAWATWNWDDGDATKLLSALAAGYETANRLAKACHPAQSRAGSAPTSTMGAIGAAVAIAKLRDLPVETFADAIGNAAFYAPLAAYEGLAEHGSVVPLHGGMAARTGYEAVLLAEAGLGPGEHLLEGAKGPGFIEFLHGSCDGLEPESWHCETLDAVYFKPLPGCRHVHPALEALLAILAEGPVDPASVVEMRVDTYRMALLFNAVPRPGGELYDRLMSLPWVLASALVRGGYGIDNLAEREDSPAMAALLPRIAANLDEDCEAAYPGDLCARVTLRLEAGPVRRSECRLAYGTPSEGGPYSPVGTTTPPLDEDGMRRKFPDLSRRSMPEQEARRFLNLILPFETTVTS